MNDRSLQSLPACEQSILSPNSAIRGVLAYVDVIATPHMKEVATAVDQGMGLATIGGFAIRRAIKEEIQHAFKMMKLGTRLNLELEAYGLFFHEHSADAMAAGWCREKRGENPADALNADYDLYGGLISERDPNELRAQPEDSMDSNTWRLFAPRFKPGDRIFDSKYGGGLDCYLVRGTRIVWETTIMHWQMSEEALVKIAEEIRCYNKAGGTAAVLSGKLVWPPPGWINPISDAAAEVEANRRRRVEKLADSEARSRMSQ